jgi:hypothetical protein
MIDSPTRAAPDDRTPLALAAGLVAALLGAAGWAAVVLIADLEVGWVAWAIGGLVGLAMGQATRQRSRSLALTAAALALVGLVAGKALVVAGSAGAVADELMDTPEYLQGAMAWQLYEAGELEPGTLEAIRSTEAAGDTISDELWADMVAQAAVRMDGMDEDERRALADEVAGNFVQQLGVVDGVISQLSAFDLLWMFLALGTAFRMMDATEEEPAPVLAGADPEEAEPVA